MKIFISQNEPITDGTVPKKAYSRTKTPVKPSPAKIMVKRDAEKKPMFLEDGDMIKIEYNEEQNGKNADVPLTRSRRSIRTFYNPIGSQLSPLSVTYAANYNEKENKGWVKPLFSSIVYRLPVSYVLD